MLFESYWPLPQIPPSPGELTSQEVGKILSKSLTTFMALLNVVIFDWDSKQHNIVRYLGVKPSVLNRNTNFFYSFLFSSHNNTSEN